MRILYLANVRVPSERAHAIQAVEMCSGFASLDNEVTLLVPKNQKTLSDGEVHNFYGIPKNFAIRRVWMKYDFFGFQANFFVRTLLFMLLSLGYFLSHYRLIDVVYAKDEKLLYLLSFFTKNIVWEPHVGEVDFMARRVARKALVIVALTNGVRLALVREGVPVDKIIVAHDAVRLEMFNKQISKHEARVQLNLPSDTTLVMYVGHLFEWKGVQVLAEAMSHLPNIKCCFVGGLEDDVIKFKERNKDKGNLIIVGNQPRHQIPIYLQAADILVLPNSARWDISKSYTSPLKLFEYMASQRPIIASRLPSLEEVLHDKNSILIEPDNPLILADSIQNLDYDSVDSQNMVNQAYQEVSQCTWLNRAKNVHYFINEQFSRQT